MSDDGEIDVVDDADTAALQKIAIMKDRARIEHFYCHVCPNEVNLVALSDAIKQKEKEIEILKASIDSLKLRRPNMALRHIKNSAEKVLYRLVFYFFTGFNSSTGLLVQLVQL